MPRVGLGASNGHAGGLVGRVDGGSVSDSHATATVTAVTGSGSSLSIGGLFGRLDGGASVAGTNYFTAGSGPSNDIGSGTCPIGACASKTEADIEDSALGRGIAGVKLSKPSINAILASPSGDYTVSWPNVPHADSYDWQEAYSFSGGFFSAWSTATKTSISQASVTSQPSGSTFRYRVRACKEAISSQTVRDCGDYSSPQSVNIGALDQVSGLSINEASGVSSDASYMVSWSAVTGASQYEITESIDNVAQTPVKVSQASQSYTGKAYGKTYSYTVKACAGSNCGLASSSVSVEVKLSSPSIDTIAASPSGNYTVEWPNVPHADSYDWQEASSSSSGGSSSAWGVASSTAIGVNSFQQVGKSSGSTFRYRVRACKDAISSSQTVRACGEYSSPQSVSIGTIGQVSNLSTDEASGVSSDASYTISWGAVTGASEYEITESIGGGAQTSVKVSQASQNYTGKVYGKTYSYTVKACAGSNCGLASSSVSMEVKLSAPSIDTITASPSGNYTVSWPSVSHADSYDWQEASSSGASFSAWSTATQTSNSSISFTSKPSGSTFRYRVRACKDAISSSQAVRDCGEYSSPQSVSIGTIGQVSGLSTDEASGVSSDASYTISWGAVADASEYEITESIGGGAQTSVKVSQTRQRHTGKAYGKTYSYTVKACAGSNCGLASSSVSVEVKLSAPSIISPITASPSGNYTVSWPNVSHADSYDWQEASSSSGASFSAWGVASSTAIGVNSFQQVGKSSGSTFRYRVRACKDATGSQTARACGGYSAFRDVSIGTIGRVSGLSTDEASGVSSDASYTISWGAVTGASEYEITESIDGVAQTPVKVSQASQNYTGKVYGKTYSYTVRACAGSNCGLTSNSVSVEVKLSAPSIDTITASPSGNYTVSWQGVTHADSYDWQEASSSGASFSAWSTAAQLSNSSISFTSKPSGSTFRYRVRACKDAISSSQTVRACGDYSVPRSVSIGTIGQVSGLSTDEANGVSSDASYTISWNAVTGASEYEITESIGRVAQTPVKVSQASQGYTGKAYGKTYSYMVKACAGSNCGLASSSVSVEVKLSAPSIISPITASPSGNYTVSWPDVSHADSYDWQEASSSWGTATTKTSTSSISFTSKPSGSTFRYRVRACKDATGSQAVRACGDYSSPQSVSIGTIGQVSGLSTDETSGVSSDASYTISWGAVTGASQYEITESIGGVAQAPVKVSQTRQRHTGKVYGKTYSYTVKACAGSNCGLTSSSVSVEVKLSAPSIVSPITASPSGSYTVSWQGVTHADSYDWQEASGGWGRATTKTSTSSISFTSKPSGSTFRYRVRACKDASSSQTVRACGDYSSPQSVSIGTIGQVSGLSTDEVSGVSSDASYTISWGAVTGASQYEITESIAGGAQTSVKVSQASQNYTGKAYGKSYSYTVKACAGSNCGLASSSVSVEVKLSVPSIVSPITASPSGSYTVSWPDVTHADSYDWQEASSSGASFSAWSTAAQLSNSSISVTSKPSGSTFRYRVRACKDASSSQAVRACGDYSTSRSVSIGTIGQVSNLSTDEASGVSSDATYTISWGAVTGASQYEITESIGGVTQAPVKVSQASQSYTGKAYGKSYSYTVKACAGSNCGLASSSVSVEVKLSVPSINRIAASPSGNYTVSWPDVTHADSYDWQEASSSGGGSFSAWGVATSTAVGVNSFQQVGKSSGSTFRYRVRACKDAISSSQTARACGDYSSPQSVSIGTIGQVSGLSTDEASGVSSDASYTISWGAVAGASQYEITESIDGVVQTPAEIILMRGGYAVPPGGHAQSPAEIISQGIRKNYTGKAYGKTYSYTVKACAGSNCGLTSSSVSVEVKLSAPSIVSPITASPSGNYTVSWQGVTHADSYDWQEASSSGASFSAWSTATTKTSNSQSGVSSISVTSKPSGSTFRYRVRACKDASSSQAVRACGDYSASESVGIGTIGQVSGLSTDEASGVSSDASYTISWNAVAGASQYEITESIGGGAQTSVKVSQTRQRHTGKAYGKTYSYTVKACAGSNCGLASSSVSVVVIVVPSISPITASPSGNYTVSWPSVAHADSYDWQEASSSGGSFSAWSTATKTSNSQSGVSSLSVTSKASGSTFRYRVRACKDTISGSQTVRACGDYSSPQSVSIGTIGQVSGLSTDEASGVSSDASYTISWNAVTGASQYEITESIGGGAQTSVKVSQASQNYTGKVYGKTYSYTVKACAGSNCSLASSSVSVEVKLSAPSIISPITASPSGNYTVSWPSVTHADSYDWQEASSSGGSFSAWSTATKTSNSQSGVSSISFTSKPSGSTFRYRVRACKDAISSSQTARACGDYSSPQSVSIGTIGQVSNLSTDEASGVSSDASYTISWSAVAGASQYEITESIGGGAQTSVKVSQTRQRHTGKAYGKTYSYTVKACAGSNCGLASSSVSVVVIVVPSIDTITASPSGNYTVSWQGVTHADSYDWQEASGGWGTATTKTSNSSISVTSKPSGSTFRYRVRACKDASSSQAVRACGDYSSPQSVSIGTIGQVSGLSTDETSGVSSDASYTISWGAVTGASQYEITESIGGVAQAPVKVSQTRQRHTGKVYGKTYSYTVKACAGSNCGLTSSSVSVEVKLSAPSIVSPITASPSGSYTVSWQGVTHADSYDWQEASGGWGRATTKTSTSSISFTSKPSGSTFRYRVRACKDASSSQTVRACGDYSSPQSVSIGTIGQVSGLSTDEVSGVSSDASYTISWGAVTGASQYEITESIGGGAQTSVKVSQTRQRHTGKVYGKTYSYTVRACAGSNCGLTSSSVSVEVKLSAPSIVSPITASPSGSYTVSWPSVTHADSYDWQEASSSGASFSAWGRATTKTSTSSISFTSKPSGSTFRYRVRACKDASSSQAVRACGDYSSPQSVSIGTIGQVSGLSTDEVSGVSSDATYTISWNAVTGASQYEITESIGGVAQAPVKVSRTSQRHTGKAYGKTYSYAVKACAGNNCGVASSSVSVDVRLAVAQNLGTSRATPSDGNYTISWNAVSGSAGGYVLQESIDIGNGTNWTAVVLARDNATSHDFANREGETNYKYRVRACVTTGCAAGTSESSPWATSPDDFVQVAYPAITAIALSETTDIDGAYSFTWNKLGNASKYQIRKRSLATPLATESTRDRYQAQQASAPQRLSQSGQLGHRSYGYKIRACNSQNICTSNWSREVTVEVTLPVVSGLRSDENTSYDRKYRVSWNRIARDAGNRYGTNNANVKYKLEEKTGASLAWTSFYNGSQSSKLITKSALSTYSYRVSSCSSVGCGPSTAGSAHVSVNVLGLLAPALSSVHSPVYIGSGSGSSLSDGAELTWNSVVGATQYKIETARPASSMFTSPTWRALATQAQSSYSIAPQAAGGHLYRVTACVTATCSANLASPSSPPVTIVTHDLTPPALASDEATSNDGSYTITWPAVTGATRYVLEESSDAGTTWASIGNGTSPVVPSTKTASTSYSYRLTAHGMRNVSLTGSTLSVAVVLNCAIGTGVTWTSTSGSSPNTCEASTTAAMALGSTVKLEDTSSTFRGSATFTCTGGALVLASSASAECGTQGEVASYPIIITTYTQLKTVKNGLAKHYRLGNDIDASPSRSEGASNCVAYNGSNGATATCTGFAPIGNDTTQFAGSFDGASHKITSLYIKRSTTDDVGLFGYTATSAEIENIGVTDAYIVGSSDVGGLIGQSAGSVSNSYATGTVTGTWYNIGGLIGRSRSSARNSYATGTVMGVGHVGGLIGVADGSVSNSYATGAVTGTGTRDGFGGLIGRADDSVSNSYATGAVTGTGGNSVGGLIGYFNGFVTGKNYFVDGSGTDGIGSGNTCSGTCTRKTAAEIVALPSTSGWTVSTSGSMGTVGNWNFGTTTQLPAVLYSGTSCETISGTNNINSNEGDAKIPDCGDLLPGQRAVMGDSKANPIIITTYAQLKTIKNGLAKHYRLGNDIDASPSRSEGASNCVAYTGSNGATATCTGFEPIGNNTTQFAGSFDGDGHKITNLYIKRSITDNVGLFGYTGSNAEIKDLGVTDAYIVGDGFVGGLGGVSYGSVSNSYATGAVTGTSGNVGGLIGYSDGTVSNSYATGAVTGRNSVGGLIGYSISGSSVSNSYATGDVTGTGNGVGGLIGGTSGLGSSVSNSYATGDVTGTGGNDVGGLIGTAYTSSVSNSYAMGTVRGTGNKVGGLIGWADGSVITGKNYFVDASGGTNGLGSGTCSGTCTRQTAAEIAALTATASGWTTGSTGNWNFGTTTQLPAVLYS